MTRIKNFVNGVKCVKTRTSVKAGTFVRVAALMAALVMALMMTACGSKDKELTPEDVVEKVTPPEGFELAGDWQDSESQRAVMTIIAEDGDNYEVEINWSSGADETTTWSFTGTFDTTGGFLSYEDCQKITTKTDEDGEMQETVEYENGKGSIGYYDGYLKWEDKEEDAGKDCKFEKVPEEMTAE